MLLYAGVRLVTWQLQVPFPPSPSEQSPLLLQGLSARSGHSETQIAHSHLAENTTGNSLQSSFLPLFPFLSVHVIPSPSSSVSSSPLQSSQTTNLTDCHNIYLQDLKSPAENSESGGLKRHSGRSESVCLCVSGLNMRLPVNPPPCVTVSTFLSR